MYLCTILAHTTLLRFGIKKNLFIDSLCVLLIRAVDNNIVLVNIPQKQNNFTEEPMILFGTKRPNRQQNVQKLKQKLSFPMLNRQ